MRPLGEYLHAAGMTVYGIRLRGHGTCPQDLAEVRWQAWVQDVREGLEQLRGSCQRVSLAGLSLGAALALYTAAEEPVERLVAFSAPDGVLARRSALMLTGPLSQLIDFFPKIGSDLRDPDVRRSHFSYDRIPLRNAREVGLLLKSLDQALPRIKCPTLLLTARHDRVVPSRAARRIAARLGSPHEIVYLEEGGHTVVLDKARREAWEAARAWLT
jgi:carboxylesterase